MTALQKSIYTRALRLRLEQGMSMEDALALWPKLTEADRQELREAVAT